MAGASLRGEPTARVAVIEYSDYQCPFCAAAEHGALADVEERYVRTGKVLFALRHYPLERLHPLAMPAAEAAVCAGRSGKFWEMHSALFADQKNLETSALISRARVIGLDQRAFEACLASKPTDEIRADLESAQAIGLTGTPAFLIGTREGNGNVRVIALLNGARSAADFAKIIDPLLKSDH